MCISLTDRTWTDLTSDGLYSLYWSCNGVCQFVYTGHECSSMQRLCKILRNANWQELNLEASYWSPCFEDQQNGRGYPNEKNYVFFWRRWVHENQFSWNIISYIFIDRLTSFFLLTQKMLKRSFSPFPSSGVVLLKQQFCLRTTHNAHLNTTVTLGTSPQISNAIHKAKCYACS